ncbi:hypothetical protein Tco_1513875, partial [Tanacetum coccineum]
GPDTQSVITYNASYQVDDLDAYDFDCDEISTAKAILIDNLSSYGSYVLSEVPQSNNTNNDMLNQSVQEMPYSEPSQFVDHLENETHSDSNIILYSQYLIETQNAAVQDTYSSAKQDAMILSVFEQLSQQVTNCNKVNKDNLIANVTLSAELERYKERVKLLEERQNVDLGTREKLIIDDIIQDKNAQFADFEKEINSLKQTLSEQLKEKETLTKHLIIAEQAFWFQMSNPSIDSSDASSVKVDVPSELPKVSLVNASLKKLKFHLTQFDSVVKQRITPDALTKGEWGFEHTKAVFINEIIPFLKSLKDIFNVFDKDILNEITEVQTVFYQMETVVQ